MTITPAQCRAGRALVDISREELSRKSGVSLGAIANFENELTTPIRANLAAIKQALEQLGVEFTSRGGVQLRDSGDD